MIIEHILVFLFFVKLTSAKHEIITNTGAVDLLVSLAYVAAAEGSLDEPLPRGMGLRVKPPPDAKVQVDADKLCEFDSLPLKDVSGPKPSWLSH